MRPRLFLSSPYRQTLSLSRQRIEIFQTPPISSAERSTSLPNCLPLNSNSDNSSFPCISGDYTTLFLHVYNILVHICCNSCFGREKVGLPSPGAECLRQTSEEPSLGCTQDGTIPRNVCGRHQCAILRTEAAESHHVRSARATARSRRPDDISLVLEDRRGGRRARRAFRSGLEDEEEGIAAPRDRLALEEPEGTMCAADIHTGRGAGDLRNRGAKRAFPRGARPAFSRSAGPAFSRGAGRAFDRRADLGGPSLRTRVHEDAAAGRNQ